jgi:serine/threonine-protein kinase
MPEKSENQILFGRFKIEDCIKKDRISNVYIAWHIHLDKKILLKTLNTNEIADQNWLERFRREAKVLAHLDHPNIIRILDFGSENNTYYISFEYFEGQNLRQLIKKTSLDLDQKINILRQLLLGLKAAHKLGIIHRDIKPENILVNNELKLKLADFGLAFRAEDSKLTSQSSLIGTPAYMSPEQARGEKLSNKTDLFSVGVVAFELFQEYHPFLGEDVKNTLNNLLSFENRDIASELKPDIPAVVVDLLQVSVEQRPASAAQALQGLGVSSDAIDADRPKKNKSSKKTINYAAAILFFILAVILVYIYYPEPVTKSGDSVVTLADVDSLKDTTRTRPQTSQPILISNSSDSIENHIQPAEAKVILPDSGTLYLYSEPACEVYFNQTFLGKSPFRLPLKVPAGLHQLQLVHQQYPHYSEEINIQAGEAKILGYSLDTLFGFLSCQVYPWAMVLIDGKLIGETPLSSLVCLNQGEHQITFENPGFPSFRDTFYINRQETTLYRINLEKQSKFR